MADGDIALVSKTVEENKGLLNKISQEIWKNPELKYEEKYAHKLLTDALEKQGFSVQRNYILPTAFRAEFLSKGGKGPVAAVICEYDALPGVGHACGHNLIAEAGFGAGLAIKTALETDPTLCGKVVILGTPAEEGGGGKIALIKEGAFRDVDFAMMVHPAPVDDIFPPFIAISRMVAEYTGKEAHASGYPWEGINALDAAVLCYTNIGLLRQQIKPNCRIHAIISKGGIIPNIIPGESEIQVYVRAGSNSDLQQLIHKVQNCITSAATATGCKVSHKIIDEGSGYDYLITNKQLATLYRKYAEKLGVKFEECSKAIPFMASSDMGNVSHVVPSIHPTYTIGSSAPNHSTAFTDASGSPAAQWPTLVAAQSMANSAIEIMRNSKLLSDIRLSFKEDLEADKISIPEHLKP